MKGDIHISYTSAFPKAKSTIAFKKDWSDNNIRKFRLKEQAFGDFLTELGNAFQSRGAQLEKETEPEREDGRSGWNSESSPLVW